MEIRVKTQGVPVEGEVFEAPKPWKKKPKVRREPEPVTPSNQIKRNEPCPCGSGKKFKNCHRNAKPLISVDDPTGPDAEYTINEVSSD